MGRVLIAEDEPALLESFCELVRELGHECLSAKDGAEALQLARQHQPDVVLTDFMMPKVNGLELARALSVDAVLGKVPVVLVSAARPREEDRRLVYRFLPKPVDIDTFERAVEEALTARGAVARKPFVATAPEDASTVSLVREDMLNWVAHEIKSPLSAAHTTTQLAMRGLRSGERPEETERRLAQVARQLMRMNELVNSILDAAHLEEGRLRLDLEEVDVSEWLGSVVAYWRETNPDYEIILNDGHGLRLMADRERLRQVLDNLISNAIKYGQPAREVRIDVEAHDHLINLSVTDRGRGISQAHLPALFDRFHRVAGAGGRGHGLGLYIAAALTRLHGGNIVVRSEEGKGSTFTVSLPIAQKT